MVILPPIRPALQSSRICDEEVPAVLSFWPRMLEDQAASRLARQSAGKKLEERHSRQWRPKTIWANLGCSSTVGETSMTSMNPVSSRRRCPGTLSAGSMVRNGCQDGGSQIVSVNLGLPENRRILNAVEECIPELNLEVPGQFFSTQTAWAWTLAYDCQPDGSCAIHIILARCCKQ